MSNVVRKSPRDNLSPCPSGCGLKVIRARLDGGIGKMISIDEVPFGRGNLALTRDLADAGMLATKIVNPTSYREHRCPPAIRFEGNMGDRLAEVCAPKGRR